MFFLSDMYNDKQKALINLTASSLPGPYTEGELTNLVGDTVETEPSNYPYTDERREQLASVKTDNVKNSAGMTGTIENARAYALQNAAAQQAELYALQNSGLDTPTPDKTSGYIPIYGTGAFSEMLHNRDLMQRGRINTAIEGMHLNSTQAAVGRFIDSWRYGSAPKISKQQAESYYKSLGLDVKEKAEGISEYEMKKKAETLIKKQEYEYNLAMYNSTNDITWLNQASILGTSIAAGMFASPLDTVLTTASFLIPGAAVSGASKIAGILSAANKTERVINAMSKLRTAKNVASTADAALNASKVATSAGRSVYLTTKAKLMDPKLISAVERIENVKNWNYAAMSAGAKTGLDALVWTGIDIPTSIIRKADSDINGIYQYTGKDMLTDFLTAGALGVVLPGSFRLAGKALGIRPFEMVERQMGELETRIKTNVARGEILPTEAKVQLAELKKLKSDMATVSNAFKKPHKDIQDAVDQLQRANISTETLRTRMQVLIESLRAGQRISVMQLPEYESIFSHIDARVLNGLLGGQSAKEVFGKNLIITQNKFGRYEAKVIGETGLLGRFPITGKSEEEVIEQLGNMYKGFVLEDPNNPGSQSLAKFMTWVQRDQSFIQDLEDIFSDYSDAFNKNKGKTGRKISIKELKELNIRGRIEDAYLKYKLGDKGYLEHEEAAFKDTFMDANGRGDMDSALTEEMMQAEKEAKEFADKWLVEFKTKQGKGTGAYDFVNPEKHVDDKGAAFQSYLNSYRRSTANNIELSNSDNLVKNMRESQVKDFLEKVNTLDVSEDTDFKYLFSTPRKSLEEYNQMVSDNAAWNDVLTRKKIELNDARNSSEGRKQALNFLNKGATAEDSAGAAYTKSRRAVAIIDSLKAKGFGDIKANLFNILRDPEKYKSLGESVERFIASGRPNIYIKESIKEAIETSFKETRLGDFLPGNIKEQIVGEAYRKIMDEISGNREVLKALYNLDKAIKDNPDIAKATTFDLKGHQGSLEQLQEMQRKSISSAKKKLWKNREDPEARQQLENAYTVWSEMKGEERKAIERNTEQISKEAAILSEIQTNMEVLFSPIEKSIDTNLTRIQIQSLHNMDIMETRFALMLEHPEMAAEIVTAGATQTIYDFNGARRNLEYIRRSAGLYENDVYNKLLAMDSKDGTGLAPFFASKDNREYIEKALVSLKHGAEYTENSDAARIARVIMDEQSTLFSDFSKYGSAYDRPMDLIDRRQLKYADGVFSNSDVEKMKSDTDILGSVDVIALPGTMMEEKGIRYGENLMSMEEGQEKIAGSLQDIQKNINAFFDITKPSVKKVALWALKDFDLDSMFDKGSSSRLGLNRVRDAILSGNITDLVDGDYLNLYYLQTDIKRIRNAIIGAESSTEATLDSWVDNFYKGFKDFGGVVDGRRSAYLDAFEDTIQFKDAKAETNAVSKFGYDTMQRMMIANFDKALKAQYSLEIFGSDPLGIARDLMNTFERTRKGSTKAHLEYREKLKARAAASGTDAATKFQITKAQQDSVERYIKYACGMREQAPTDGVRVMQSLRTLMSFPLLAKAGFKSLSDWGTIGENMIANGLVGRGQALATISRTLDYFKDKPEMWKHLAAAATVETEDLVSWILNDPTLTFSRISENVSAVDKLEAFAHKLSTGFLDNLAHVGDLTNTNKKIAAMTIQSAIGNHKGRTFKELKEMSYALENEGITEPIWDLFRNYMIRDLNGGKGTAYNFFDVYKAAEIPDDVLESTMKKLGKTDLSQTAINRFRKEIQSKAFTLVNSSADEFISMPSERVMSKLRGNQVKGSWSAFWVESATQYQAFPMAMAYNTYGREVGHAVKGLTGVTAIDMFNPMNKFLWAAQSQLYYNIFRSVFNIGMSMLLVDTTAEALAGKVERVKTEQGDLNLDLIMRRVESPLGPVGVVMDSLFNMIDASGQRGGGLSVQMAPAASNLGRVLYRQGRILKSDKVQNKGQALGAEFLNEAGRVTGLKTLPFVAPVYQSIYGSYLDMLEYGGEENWNTMLNNRERRGSVVMPWEENPQPFNPALFEGL